MKERIYGIDCEVTHGYSGSADFEDFGKTVFLTREEAEAALRREQE